MKRSDPTQTEAKHTSAPQPPPDSEGWARILAERARQQTVEGFTVEYDRTHPDCRLFHAAEAYMHPDWVGRIEKDGRTVPRRWWLPPEMWKLSPGNRARDLEKAGALYLAECERQGWADHASTAARMRAKAIQCARKLDRILREEKRQQGIRERALARRVASEARKVARRQSSQSTDRRSHRSLPE